MPTGSRRAHPRNVSPKTTGAPRPRARPRRRRATLLAVGVTAASLAILACGVWLLCSALAGRRAPALRRHAEVGPVALSPAPTTPEAPAAPPAAPPPPLPTPAAPAPPAPQPTPPPPAPFKRLDTLTEEALRKQLLEVPEVALDQVRGTSRALREAARASAPRPYPGPAALLADRVALNGLPFLADRASRLGKEQAEDLGALSNDLHRHVQACTSGSGPEARLDLDRFRQLLAERREGRAQWRGPEALPALLQILQVEGAPARRLLVEMLAAMEGPRADSALAVRAVVDLSADVRQAAVRALVRRPPGAYRGLLLAGFRYPWPPAAAHAAEALVALGDRGAVPALEALLDEPPPGLPPPAGSGRPRPAAVRELVRVSHLKNCLLCHPPSFQADDPVRGAVPGSDLPSGGYGGGLLQDFVRADITYLRQDFSLLQPVARRAEGEPELQRYDYLVRVRPLTPTFLARLREKQERVTREYRAAVRFALRELSGAAP